METKLAEHLHVEGDLHAHIHEAPKKESFTPTHFRYNLPSVNRNFTGRTELLEQLNHAFELKTTQEITDSNTSSTGSETKNTSHKKTKPIVLTAFHGLGGIGKTELAKAFIYAHLENYQGIYWLSADNEETLLNSYMALAQELKLGATDKQEKPKDTINRVKRWLENNPNYLMIFDNAPNYPTIQDYIPNLGHIIVTSRYTEWNEATPFLIEQFTLEESRDYIKKILQQDPRRKDELKDIDALAELLGHLPLALAQACAYIKKTRIAIARYQELYAQSKKRLLDDKTLKSDNKHAHESVWVTWDITMMQIKETSPLAAELLYLCAYLHPSDIPQNLLKKIAILNPQNEPFEEALSLLAQYSMMSINLQIETVSMHLLVKEVLLLKRSREQQRQDIILLYLAIEEIYPYNRKEMTSYQVLKNILPHLKSLVQINTQLLPKEMNPTTSFAIVSSKEIQESKLSIALTDKESVLFIMSWICFARLLAEGNSALGLTHEAKEHWEKLLNIQEAHYGKDHIETANTLHNLANAIGALGDEKSAKTSYERTLKIKEARYGKDHIETASTLMNLAITIGVLGDEKSAKTLYERTLNIFEAHYGKDHIETASTLNNLASVIGNLGDLKTKKNLLERTLSIFESHYGKDHIKTASTLGNLASAIGDLGDEKSAKTLYERMLKIKEAHYGKDHIETANTLHNLAITIGALGDVKTKKTLLERTLNIFESHYGKDHIETAKVLMNLAIAIGNLGDLKTKKTLLERTLNIQETHYGKDHIETANTLGNLANAIWALGDEKSAKTFYERTLNIFESHYGKDHIETAKVLMNLAIAIGDLGDLKTKKTLLERTLNIQETHYGKDHIETASTLMNLASAIYELGDVQSAKTLYERTLKIKEAHYGKDHIETASTLMNLASAIYELGDVQSAKTLYERTLNIQEVHYGKDHIETASTLNNLASVIRDLGDEKSTKTLYERTLKIKEAHYGKDHIETASTLNNLASVIRDLGDEKSAKTLYERTLKIKEAHYGKDHIETASTLMNLAIAYFKLNHLALADTSVTKALSLLMTHYDENHPNTQKAIKLKQLIRIPFSLMNTAKEKTRLNQGNPTSKDKLITQDQATEIIKYYLIKCYLKAIQLGGTDIEIINAHHNLARLYHVQKQYQLSQQHFEQGLSLKKKSSVYCDYGLLLINQKQYLRAIDCFLKAIALNDNTELSYGVLDKKLLDSFLQLEINPLLDLKPIIIAHYWLIDCYHALGQFTEQEKTFKAFADLIEAHPGELNYRLLSYVFQKLDSKAKVYSTETKIEQNTKKSTLSLTSIKPSQVKMSPIGTLVSHSFLSAPQSGLNHATFIKTHEGKFLFQLTERYFAEQIQNELQKKGYLVSIIEKESNNNLGGNQYLIELTEAQYQILTGTTTLSSESLSMD